MVYSFAEYEYSKTTTSCGFFRLVKKTSSLIKRTPVYCYNRGGVKDKSGNGIIGDTNNGYSIFDLGDSRDQFSVSKYIYTADCFCCQEKKKVKFL